MNTRSKQLADAEETCKLLEEAVLKYFPPPIEIIDSADCDRSIDPPSGCPPKSPTSTVLIAVRRSLSFLCLPHSLAIGPTFAGKAATNDGTMTVRR